MIACYIIDEVNRGKGANPWSLKISSCPTSLIRMAGAGAASLAPGGPMMLVARLDVDTSTGCLKPPFHESILLSELAEDDFS